MEKGSIIKTVYGLAEVVNVSLKSVRVRSESGSLHTISMKQVEIMN